ncbi:MAG: 2-oxo acid dehydrogenase subunit E2 [Vicinamibacteria bacterium]|nr:2-oxo acid dehydrogenase subunit E2 [Vicinamibacteria bacterium]
MTDVIMPQMGESVAEGTVTRWLKRVGERVHRDEPLLEISTDKVDAEVPAPSEGVLVEIRVAEGQTVAIETVLGVIAKEKDDSERMSADIPADAVEAAATATQPIPVEMTSEELRLQRSSPVVRRIAREHEVEIRDVHGTGIGGRVTKQDILGHIARRSSEKTTTADVPPAATPIERSRLVPLSPIKKKTMENMALAWHAAAHATTVWEIDMSRVAHLRDLHRASYQERYDVRLTFLPFILKATVDSLKAFPVLNSSLENDAIRYHGEVHLGVAVVLERGVIVPVVRRADEKNLLGLARAVSDLADRARVKRLQVDEVQGGTFTVTNPGVFGGLFGAPIIPRPQAGVLAVGAIEKRPVARDDAIALRETAHFALSFDHRIVEGSDADRFMADLKQRLQEFDETAL